MFTSRIIGAALAISLASALAFAQSREISVGTPVSPQELAKYFAVQLAVQDCLPVAGRGTKGANFTWSGAHIAMVRSSKEFMKPQGLRSSVAEAR